MGNSIFISYRRDGGEIMAQLLHDRFVEKGFSVFYDIESMTSGMFDTKIFTEISKADYFVLILPPNGLDRCRYDNDWVRQEIRHALKLNKVIIPVMLRGFEFPHDLPDDIVSVSKCNGVRFDDMNYLDAKINKVIELFDAPGNTANDASHRRSGPSMITLVNSIGAVDINDSWPDHKKYSAIVSMDMYNAIYFHSTLFKPYVETKTVPVGYQIFDNMGNLILDYEGTITFQPSHTRFSLGWILKNEDGSCVRAGRYKIHIWIENSRVYEYNFMITSSEQDYVRMDGGETRFDIKQTETTPQIHARVAELRKKLSRPKGLFFASMIFIFFFVSQTEVVRDSALMLLVVLAGELLSFFFLYRYTVKNVVSNPILAAIISVFGLGFYIFYLIFTSLLCFSNKKKWKDEYDKLSKLL